MSRFSDAYDARKRAEADQKQLIASFNTIRENIDLMHKIFSLTSDGNFMANNKYKIYKRDALAALDFIESHVNE